MRPRQTQNLLLRPFFCTWTAVQDAPKEKKRKKLVQFEPFPTPLVFRLPATPPPLSFPDSSPTPLPSSPRLSPLEQSLKPSPYPLGPSPRAISGENRPHLGRPPRPPSSSAPQLPGFRLRRRTGPAAPPPPPRSPGVNPLPNTPSVCFVFSID